MIYSLINLEEATPSDLQLLEEAEKQCIEFGYDWFNNLANNASDPADSNKLLCVKKSTNSRTYLILPIRINKKNRSIYSLTNFYSSLFSPISLEEPAYELMQFAFRNLKNEGWTRIVLSPMSIDDPTFEETIRALNNSGWRAFPYYCFGNWYIPAAPNNFTDYFKTLPSQLKNTVKRKRKKFLTQNNGTLELITDSQNIGTAIEAWVNIYNASWKSPEPYSDFMPALIRLCAMRGWLRLGIAYLGEKPIAAQFWIVHNRRAEIYKLAYDESQSKHGAGSILTAFLMEHVIDIDHVTEIDYLIGDDSYKSDWMTHRRERWGIVSYNPGTVIGRLMLALEQIGRLKKTISAIFKRK
jgi:hypothetical protein